MNYGNPSLFLGLTIPFLCKQENPSPKRWLFCNCRSNFTVTTWPSSRPEFPTTVSGSSWPLPTRNLICNKHASKRGLIFQLWCSGLCFWKNLTWARPSRILQIAKPHWRVARDFVELHSDFSVWKDLKTPSSEGQFSSTSRKQSSHSCSSPAHGPISGIHWSFPNLWGQTLHSAKLQCFTPTSMHHNLGNSS